jgi:hypothetical protein
MHEELQRPSHSDVHDPGLLVHVFHRALEPIPEINTFVNTERVTMFVFFSAAGHRLSFAA